MNLKLDTIFHLSTDGYSFKYRRDRYNPSLIHVEMFKDGNVVHKQRVVCDQYKINMSHHNVINALETKISLNEFDSTGLKQLVPYGS